MFNLRARVNRVYFSGFRGKYIVIQIIKIWDIFKYTYPMQMNREKLWKSPNSHKAWTLALYVIQCVCDFVCVCVCALVLVYRIISHISHPSLSLSFSLCIRIRGGIRANASALYTSLLHFCVGLLNINAISLWPITLQPIRVLMLIRFRIRRVSPSLLCKCYWTTGAWKEGGGVGVVTLGLLLLLYGLLEFLVQIVIEIDKPKVAR